MIIPKANVRNLMLDPEVIDAVAAKKFHVWAVTSIDEGIELLTGVPAGRARSDGTYPPESVHGRVQALRGRRDSTQVEAALARVKEDAAHEDRNLMSPIVEASMAYVTMGEMCDALRDVWGVWRETPVF